MLETLCTINSDFQAALDKFWKDYATRPHCITVQNIDSASAILDHHKAVLSQVLDMRAKARRIRGILNETPLKDLERKEN